MDLKHTLKNIPDPPCDKFACNLRQSCGERQESCSERQESCSAFVYYVETGRRVDPHMVMPDGYITAKRQPEYRSVIETTRELFTRAAQ